MWSLECAQAISKIWPSDLLFDPTWPNIELDLDFVKINILSKFEEDWAKTVSCRVIHDFPKIWPSDLLIDPAWPSFEFGLDFVKINILSKFEEDWIKTVSCRVITNCFWRTDRQIDAQTHARTTTDAGNSRILKVHPELSSGELKRAIGLFHIWKK